MDGDFLEALEWLDNYDYCNECQWLGDDYYFDDDGNPESSCWDCPFNPYKS